jgi:hypothetical protein
MPRKKIKENPDLVKDEATKAVINTNVDAYAARRTQMAIAKGKESEFEKMKQDIAEIKKLLKGLSK